MPHVVKSVVQLLKVTFEWKRLGFFYNANLNLDDYHKCNFLGKELYCQLLFLN